MNLKAWIAGSQQRRSNAFLLLLAEWSISNLGHYAVLSILAIYFLQTLTLPPGQAAALVLIFSLSLRLSRILLAPLVDRLVPRTAITLALFVSALGYLSLSIATVPATIVAALLVIGAGVGTNVLAVKTMAANTAREGQSPLLRYASLSMGLNFAAAVGPIIGSALFLSWRPTSVFVLAAVAYAAAGIIALRLPRSEHRAAERPSWIAGIKANLRLPAMRRAMLFTALSFFLYSQLYATLPLFVQSGLQTPSLLGTYLTLNAVLVIGGQLPLSKLLTHWGASASTLLLAGYLLFGVGFSLLWFFPLWQIAYVAVVFWTLGEMLIMPMLDTLVAEGVPAAQRTVAFALSGLAVGIGDGLGSSVGVALGGWLLQRQQLLLLYGVFAVVAVIAAGIVLVVFRAAIFTRARPA